VGGVGRAKGQLKRRIEVIEELLSQLENEGYHARVVSVHHLGDLREEFEGRLRQGLIDPELYQEYLADLSLGPPRNLPEARSMIVVAVPQPKLQITFAWDGEHVPATVPPTYPERTMDVRVQGLLRRVLEPAGYRVEEAVLPKKLLAVRSGLAAYGRNNITYVPGLGSFFGLVTAYSDLPALDDHWLQPQMMERCENCSACRNHCPTGAISTDRFLLHAERCISFHNEKPGAVPFPEWLDPSWHNCLVGCLHCQRVCPENRDVWHWLKDGAEFSRRETAMLLMGLPFDQLLAATVEKLDRMNLDAYADVLPRNLNALLTQRG
jgi:epoxyqueuosine reductase